MKRVALLGGVLALALAGCGLIRLPPIDNPFGLDDRPVTFNLVAGQASDEVTFTFGDLNIPNLPFNPSGFSYDLEILGVSFAEGCPDPTPSRINVTMSATLTISDGSGASAQSTADNVRFTLTGSGDQITVGPLTNGTLNLLNVGQVLSIIQQGGENTAVLATQITTESTPALDGCAMTIIWGGGQGVIRF